MQFIYRDEKIVIPSTESNEIQTSKNQINEICEIITTIQTNENESKENKEYEEIIEKGFESLTNLNLVLEDFKFIQEKLLMKLKMNLRTVSKVLLLNENDPIKQNELKQDMNVEIESNIPMLTSQQILQLNDWTGLECNEIVFDSNVHDWSRYNSELNERIFGKKQLCLIIEDIKGDKFGCFIKNEINREFEFIYDNNAFVFSLESNGRLDGMKKFPIKNPANAFELYTRNGRWLFSVGRGGSGEIDDINIMKSDCQDVYPGNGCSQHSYDYNNVKNALCGFSSFAVKQFLFVSFN